MPSKLPHLAWLEQLAVRWSQPVVDVRRIPGGSIGTISSVEGLMTLTPHAGSGSVLLAPYDRFSEANLVVEDHLSNSVSLHLYSGKKIVKCIQQFTVPPPYYVCELPKGILDRHIHIASWFWTLSHQSTKGKTEQPPEAQNSCKVTAAPRTLEGTLFSSTSIFFRDGESGASWCGNLRASHFDLSDDEETCPWPPNLLKEARAAKSASAHDRSADQENIDPAPLYRKIDRLEGKVAFAKSQLREEKTKTVEARVQQQNTRRTGRTDKGDKCDATRPPEVHGGFQG
ncbi:hypothetical protein B0H14DRAFT_3175187 [Mycena olivaceomarginata]|nr:hypothetical protein B0H14DRAFT_3175187 [Mycena olivaceomarginata]